MSCKRQIVEFHDGRRLENCTALVGLNSDSERPNNVRIDRLTVFSLSPPSPQLWESFRQDAMDDDTSDILGRPSLHNVRGHRSGAFSGLSIVLSIPAVLILYWVATQIWERFLIWREKSYKLCIPIFRIFSMMCLQLFNRAMRRRHGIPDNDHRPFNVAYAAVVRARQEEEVSSRRAKVQQVLMQDQSVASPNENIRHRQGLIISTSDSPDLSSSIFDYRSFTKGPFRRASGCSRAIRFFDE